MLSITAAGSKFDCVQIPGLSAVGGTALNVNGNLCGLAGLASAAGNIADATAQKTLCSKL